MCSQATCASREPLQRRELTSQTLTARGHRVCSQAERYESNAEIVPVEELLEEAVVHSTYTVLQPLSI